MVNQKQPVVSVSELPIACSLSDRELAMRSESVRSELFAGATETVEFESGYAFRFSAEGDWWSRIVEFVNAERHCCSFFKFEIIVEPGSGPIWLSLSGADGVKQFIETTFATGLATK